MFGSENIMKNMNLIILSIFVLVSTIGLVTPEAKGGKEAFVIDHNFDWEEFYSTTADDFVFLSYDEVTAELSDLLDYDDLFTNGPDSVLTDTGIKPFDACRELPLCAIAISKNRTTLGISSSWEFDEADLNSWGEVIVGIMVFYAIDDSETGLVQEIVVDNSQVPGASDLKIIME